MKLIIFKEKREDVEGIRKQVTTIDQKIILTNGEKDVDTEYGKIKKADITDGRHKTDRGKDFFVIPAGLADQYKYIKKLAQTIPLKDIATIIAETGMNRETRVLDSGLGSGGLAIAMANVCKEVISYEIREEHQKTAQENITAMGINNIIVKTKNIYEECDEKDIDVVTLDLPEPWRAIDVVDKAIKAGGWLISYSPSTTQVQQFCNTLREKENYLILKTVEILERPWKVEGVIVRPKGVDIGHSGFMTFARKLA